MSLPSSDAGIPLLTEVISPPGTVMPERQIPTVESSAFSSGVAADGGLGSNAATKEDTPRSPMPPMDTALKQPVDSMQWETLERELRGRIIARLQSRIDTVIEERTQEALADLLQIAVDSITNEIRQGLHQAVADTVSLAVAQEISLLKEKK